MTFAKELEDAAAAVRQGALPAVVGVGRRGPGGSGLVFAEGVVVTSAHNVRGESALVHFADQSERESSFVFSDIHFDLAVLRVATDGAQPLAWAAEAPKLGSAVFAAANPGGRGHRLSFGVVSALDQVFPGPAGDPLSGGFEHTAPLPRGSSGGPVLNFQGELVGINTSREGEGLYQALLADSKLRERIEALGRGEASVRGWLGVGLLPGEVTKRLRQAVGLGERSGLLVRQVAEGGPAGQAGVKTGDLLTRAGEVDLRRASDLHRVLSESGPGKTLALQLVRGTEELSLEAVLAVEPPPEPGTRRRHHGRFAHPG